MSQIFDVYAQYYDLLYGDKDYETEAAYVTSRIRESLPNAKYILELGCGTGAHAESLARMGFIVHGVDLSETMVKFAKARKSNMPHEIANRLSFSCGDIRNVRIKKTYDAVISLFHVMSYQSSNNDLKAVFDTASVHLHSGGLFLFDFWYGPAVLSQRPEVRVKRLEDDEIKITRIAEPVLYENENRVDVNYNVFIEIKAKTEVKQIQETHKMRYLFLPELEFFANPQTWRNIKIFRWMDLQEPDKNTWSAFASVSHQ